MKAAVITSFEQPPSFADFAEPIAGPGEVLVHVRAASLNQLTRGQASGRHYSSGGGLPMIPGADGVGTLHDGRRIYFALPRSPFGAMAELSVVSISHWVGVPDELDDITAAAAGNPGMSSWAALTERAKFVAGENVLIQGATGTSGRLAIQIARHLGARRIVATGRNEASVKDLPALGADAVIALDQTPEQLVDAFRQAMADHSINVVLDYLWGPAAESLLRAAAGKGSEAAAPRIRYVQIGSLAGNAISLPAAALRSSGLELMGSGLGSVSTDRLLAGIGEFFKAIVPAKMKIEADPRPLAEVEDAWTNDSAAKRAVFTI